MYAIRYVYIYINVPYREAGYRIILTLLFLYVFGSIRSVSATSSWHKGLRRMAPAEKRPHRNSSRHLAASELRPKPSRIQNPASSDLQP